MASLQGPSGCPDPGHAGFLTGDGGWVLWRRGLSDVVIKVSPMNPWPYKPQRGQSSLWSLPGIMGFVRLNCCFFVVGSDPSPYTSLYSHVATAKKSEVFGRDQLGCCLWAERPFQQRAPHLLCRRTPIPRFSLQTPRLSRSWQCSAKCV